MAQMMIMMTLISVENYKIAPELRPGKIEFYSQ
jgi:hypothetical protein